MANKLKVGYVPEHFSAPLLQLSNADSSFSIIPQPSGTGQMISSLKDGTIDVSIALTESLIAGIAKGADFYKLVGLYVNSPLTWAAIVGKDSRYQSIKDLRGEKVGISRIGSGSQVMASVMALNEGWFVNEESKELEQIEFQVNDNFKVGGDSGRFHFGDDENVSQLQNLRDSVNEGTTAAFLWEWFTTKPFSDSGEVRFIGKVVTPWPSWVIAARPDVDPEVLKEFLDKLSKNVREFDDNNARSGSSVAFVSSTFNLHRDDVKAWLATVSYPEDVREIKEEMVMKVLETLETAGVVKAPQEGWKLDQFVRREVAKVV